MFIISSICKNTIYEIVTNNCIIQKIYVKIETIKRTFKGAKNELFDIHNHRSQWPCFARSRVY